MKVGVVIPAFNAGDQLDQVLSNVKQYLPPEQVIVVNDGSEDNTAVIAHGAGVHTLSHRENCGKGAALKSGFAHARQLNWDGVITLDADGQHAPSCIPQFIDFARSDHCDLVIGYRPFKLGVMPPDRIFSNRVSSAMVSLLAGRHIPDSQCGYRFISMPLLQSMKLLGNHYEMETELLVKALRSGCKLGLCAVPVIYNDHPSHMHRGLDTWRFCKLFSRLLFNRNRDSK